MTYKMTSCCPPSRSVVAVLAHHPEEIALGKMDGQLPMAALGLARPRPRLAAQHRLLVNNMVAHAAQLVRTADAVPAYLQK